MKNIISKTNLLWTIIICLLAISALLVGKQESDLIKEYISFTASITSIILAVVAIIYAMLSNQTFQNTLSNVQASAERVASETATLSKVSTGMSAEAEEIIKRLGELPKTVTDFRGEVSKKIDELSSFTGSTDLISSDSAVNAPSFKSNGHVMALYMMARSCKSGRSIDFNEIFPDDSDRTPKWYTQGIIEMFKVYKIQGCEIEGIEGVFVVNSMGSIDPDNVIADVDETLKKEKNFWLRPLFKKLDQYFDYVYSHDERSSTEAVDGKNPKS